MTVLTVNNIIDELDGDYTAGDFSLREAIATAGAGDTIVFDAALSGGTVKMLLGDIALTQDITIDGDIDGDNKADIVIEGGDNGGISDRVFDISGTNTDVAVQSLKIFRGNTNHTPSTFGGGGAIRITDGNLTIKDVTFESNGARYGGGAIQAINASLNIANSLFHANSSDQSTGGAISLESTSSATIANTTFQDNRAINQSGGAVAIDATSSLSLYNSTVTENRASYNFSLPTPPQVLNAGGIDNLGTLNIINSVVALNTVGGGLQPLVDSDITGDVTSAGYSFFGLTETIVSDNGGNINGGGDPMLEGLADNKGTVATRNALPGSALIDAGNAALRPLDTLDIDNDGDTTELLPIDANGLNRASGALDIGAVEAFSFLVVDTIADNDDGDISAGNFSLREALARVHDGGTINFAPELAGQTLALNQGSNPTQFVLTNSLTIDGDIDGDNKADITLDGNARQIFQVSGAYTDVHLESLTLTGGSGSASGSSQNGGAVYATGNSSVSINDSTIVNNTAVYGAGGAIAIKNASLSLVNVLLNDNSAKNQGGAIWLENSGVATFYNTTVNENVSGNFGGGVYIASTSAATLFNSTIVGNVAEAAGFTPLRGGGIYNNGALSIVNSVISQNTSGGMAATPGSSDINGSNPVTNATNSFIGLAATITTDNGGNINGGGDALLGELLDNGGPTLTLSPLDGSPLIGSGSNINIPLDTHDIDNDGNTAEQLPLDGRSGVRIVGGTVDMGAVEQIDDEIIRGTDGVNNIVGGDGDDLLEGKAGADVIDGGAHGANGDTVTYISSTSAVQVNLDAGNATGGHAAGDVITNVENLIGSNFGDTLTGSNVANFIDGGLGNDTLNGLGGNDILTGSISQDTLNGGDDDDDLDGGAGNDTIDGGAGNDTGRYDSFGGTVTINLNVTSAQNTGAAGTDTITNVENLIGGIGNDRFTGKVQVSVLDGGAGSDFLFGLGGNDILTGGSGNDNVQGGSGNDTLNGDAGRDTLSGSTGIDVLDGGIENDQLRGGADSDTLTGGAGRDVLIGGDVAGGFPGDGAADMFVFNDVTDSIAGGTTRDIIRDFEQTLDTIDLSGVDAITGGINDPFTFIGTSAFSNTAGELRAFNAGPNTVVRADVDGDGTADFEIFLNGSMTMTTGDFVL